MKLSFVFAVLLISAKLFASPQDTISHWNILIGEKKIAELNEFVNYSILIIDKTDITKSSLVVQYIDDTPCYKCLDKLIIKNSDGVEIMRVGAYASRSEFMLKPSDQEMDKIFGSSVLYFYFVDANLKSEIQLFGITFK